MAIKTNMTSLLPRRQQYKKTITLMSHGYSNPHAWPDGQLTVYPWDSEMDAYLLEASKQDSGSTVLFDLLARCANLNGGSVDDFVADEVNAVLLVSRALAADNIIRYQSRCPSCGTKRQEKILVPDELEKMSEKSKDYPGYDEIILPVCKDIVYITPLLVRQERLLASRPVEEKLKINDVELRHLLHIVSINSTKPDTAEELAVWYRALHPTDVRFLTDKEKELTPHLNTLLPHKCDNSQCRMDFFHMLTFDQDFFRPTKPT